MSLSIKVTNTVCQAGCEYCYEIPLRENGRGVRPFDLDAIMNEMEYEWKKTSLGQSGQIYLHGGEALTAGHEVVEKLLRKAYELSGSSSIQTYGYLIDDRYIKIFKKYKTSVGISIDGPYPLNELRKVPGQNTEEITKKVHENIKKLKDNGISVGMIVVLHKKNAVGDRLNRLKEWIIELRDKYGVDGGRLNMMVGIHPQAKKYELTPEEAKIAWTELAKLVLVEEDELHWQPFHDIVSNLLGLEQGTCTFNACQYYHAHTEPVIFSDGKTGTCLKTCGKDGHVYPRYLDYKWYDDSQKRFGLIRYDILPKIPQEDGGCKGCKYWRNCLGGCPSAGIDNDWRNKTRFCEALKGLFELVEKHLKRLMPNIVLSTDKEVTFLSKYGITGMQPKAFVYMDYDTAKRPSSWRREAKESKKENHMQIRVPIKGLNGDGCKQFTSPIEHLDGHIRHLDSNYHDLKGEL
ncbi:hypothetical protein BBF96_03555 [Anoxybacter fermentans]|uniref:Radical SAM core domain-containing protein n=1 Tax=Anoxybacter fermentans TaxID=1323375 RepID=A0A3Q9HPD2_9FIRM|nr:radical SAM protein [Anoxybacter fermentans]AZR72539.1 hypothetical protein BBF96_03555 [Anoxybacter fermentans]